MVVLTLFSLGVVAIPLVLVVGLVIGADVLWVALAIGAGCLILAALWTYALDTARWIGPRLGSCGRGASLAQNSRLTTRPRRRPRLPWLTTTAASTAAASPVSSPRRSAVRRA